MSNFVKIDRELIDYDRHRKNSDKFLAWADFSKMAAYEDYVAKDGVQYRAGEVIASYGFLATRWGKSKGLVYGWVQQWITDGRLVRLSERCEKREAERFFIPLIAERSVEKKRSPERKGQRMIEPIKRIQQSPVDLSPSAEFLEESVRETFLAETIVVLETLEELCTPVGIRLDIDATALNLTVQLYAGKIQFKQEVRQLVVWYTHHQKKFINSSHVVNWFRIALEKQKRRELALKEMSQHKPVAIPLFKQEETEYSE